MQQTGTASSKRKTAQRNAAFAVLCTTCFLLAFLSTALNTALPGIARDFAVSASDAQWTVSAYALALAVIMPLSAFLVERIPSRTLYLTALALHLSCSAVCAVCTSFEAFIAARVVQACANGIIASLTQVTILSIFGKGEQGLRMGWFGMSVGVAPVLAPAIGGVLVDALGWRSIFWIVAGLFALDLCVSFRVIDNALETRRKSFDLPGFIASALGLAGLTLGVGNLSSLGMDTPATWVALLVGAVGLVAFVVREQRCDHPLLNLRILANAKYRSSVSASAALYAAMMGSAAVLPIFVQGELGETAAIAGLVVLPGAAAMAIANPFAGRALDKYGIQKLIALSGAMLVAGNALVCVPGIAHSLPAQAALAVVRYIAIGLAQMPLSVWGNGAIEKRDLPSGTALLTSLRNVAGALGVAAFVGIAATADIGIAYAGMAAVSLGVFLPLFASRASRVTF